MLVPPPQLPIPKILFHPLAWGLKVTIPSSYRWKYAPLWLINHPRRLELDSLFLPWYRQPNHTLYLVFQWRIRGGGGQGPPPPGMWMTSHGQCPRGGACECPRVGVFSIFWRADDVTRTMSKGAGGLWMSSRGGGGVLVNVFTPPPSGNPVSAPVFHLSKFRPPPDGCHGYTGLSHGTRISTVLW